MPLSNVRQVLVIPSAQIMLQNSCAVVQEGGEWVPSQANFTSLATPNAVGSGKTALNTLLHEGK